MKAEKAYSVPFTQFLRPDGREQKVSTLVSKEVFLKVQEILRCGLQFQAEVLSTGEVSFTVFEPVTEIDIAIRLSPNGPAVKRAIELLVDDATKWLDTHPKK